MRIWGPQCADKSCAHIVYNIYTVGAGAGVCIHNLGGDAGVGVCMPTLGSDAGVGSSWMFGGPPDGKLKIAQRLSPARSWV